MKVLVFERLSDAQLARVRGLLGQGELERAGTALEDLAKSYPNYQPIMRQMKLLQNGAFVAVRKAMPEYYDFPGLPIRTKIRFQGQGEATTTVISISQAAIPDSEFTVPADYAEIKLPDLELHAKPPVPPLAPSEVPSLAAEPPAAAAALLSLDLDDRGPATPPLADLTPVVGGTITKPAKNGRPTLKITYVLPGEKSPLTG